VAPRGRVLSEARQLTGALESAVTAASVAAHQAVPLAPAAAGPVAPAQVPLDRAALAHYYDAVARLAALDLARVQVVAGAVVRSLLERLHPDGLTGEDAAEVLGRCARAGRWLPDLDVQVLLVLVTGALGLLDVADQPVALSPTAVVRHLPLLITSLLRDTGTTLAPALEGAMAELRRAETVEMP